MSDAFKVKGLIEVDSKDADKAIDKTSSAAKELAGTMGEAKKSASDYRKAVMELASTFRKQGVDSSEALKKAYASVDKSLYDLKGDAKKALRGMEEDAEKHGKGIREALGGAFDFAVGDLISGGLREALNFMKQFAAESISAASDLAEVQNVVDVTFGEGASEIDMWAKAAKNAFGMGELKAKQFSGTMGAMLKSMSFTDDEVMDMSTNLVQLAGDMASFYNLEHEEAFEKIRSGISGETEPLKQLGINMSVANLEAYAMAQGIDKAYESMTQAEQAALRYNYLISATADAAGDFSRTSDGYAGQVRLLEENLLEVKTAFGSALMEAVTPAIQLLNDWLAGDYDPVAAIGEQQNASIAETEWNYGITSKLIDDIETMQKEMGDAVYDTDEWQMALDNLAKTMPELAQYIDFTTGRLKISTEELRENAKAVREYQILNAIDTAIGSYKQAQADAETALIGNLTQQQLNQTELEAARAETEAAKNELRAWTSQDPDALLNGGEGYRAWAAAAQGWFASEEYKQKFAALEKYKAAKENEERLIAEGNALKTQQVELENTVEKSKKAVAVAEKTYDDYYTGVADGLTEQEKFQKALEDQQAAMIGVSEAAVKLKEHYDGLKASARGALESVAGSLASDIEIQTVSLENVINAMNKKNTEFSRYNQNIIAAREAGMDANILAYLTSEASAENRAILDAWVKGSDEQRAKFDLSYADYRASEDATATSMANAQGAVDETYQGLLTDYNEMVETFNASAELTAGMAANDKAIADGFSDMIGTVQRGVNDINTLMNGLQGTLSLNFSVGGNTSGDSGDNPQSNAKGLGYVPYDNYLTYLHKGETVLNRVEAENWRKGATDQSAGIDYDRLAAVLASQMAGMSMQMDGKMIGALIAPTVSRNIEKEAWRGRY